MAEILEHVHVKITTETEDDDQKRKTHWTISDFENGFKIPQMRVISFGDIVRVERLVREPLEWFPFVLTNKWRHVRFFPHRGAAVNFIKNEVDNYYKWKNGQVLL